MPEGSVRNFDEISDRLDQIIATVRSKDTSLERSLDLFDEAIELGSRAVDMVDKFELTPREADKLEQELGKVQEKLATVETQLGDSGLYESARKDELRQRLAEQAQLKAREAELEEAWLLALETLEALQQQLEEAE